MGVYYSIRVQGHLDSAWSEWFDGLTISAANGETVLTGEIIDQAALYGVLNRVRDLGLSLLAVWAHAPGPAGDQPKRHGAAFRVSNDRGAERDGRGGSEPRRHPRRCADGAGRPDGPEVDRTVGGAGPDGRAPPLPRDGRKGHRRTPVPSDRDQCPRPRP
jgi:hypothetical protein